MHTSDSDESCRIEDVLENPCHKSIATSLLVQNNSHASVYLKSLNYSKIENETAQK